MRTHCIRPVQFLTDSTNQTQILFNPVVTNVRSDKCTQEDSLRKEIILQAGRLIATLQSKGKNYREKMNFCLKLY